MINERYKNCLEIEKAKKKSFIPANMLRTLNLLVMLIAKSNIILLLKVLKKWNARKFDWPERMILLPIESFVINHIDSGEYNSYLYFHFSCVDAKLDAAHENVIWCYSCISPSIFFCSQSSYWTGMLIYWKRPAKLDCRLECNAMKLKINGLYLALSNKLIRRINEKKIRNSHRENS